MSVCRSGCNTKDHASYAECLRAARVGIAAGESAPASIARGRAWEKELTSYAEARKQGIQPASTKQKDINAAVALSNTVDKPYDATNGTFKE
jgi:hypothetical protein